MTFNDIFKSSFLEDVSSVSYLDMLLAFVFAFAIGIFIMWVYRKTFRGVLYSRGFAVSLLAMALITTMIILTISSNVILSLGMVGALSIVRFRSAVKEPMDIAYLFWAISVGIVCGAGMFPLALIGSLIIGVILVLFINRQEREMAYILVLKSQDDSAELKALELVRRSVKKYALKAKTVNAEQVETTLEVHLKGDTTGFLRELNQMAGVKSAVLVSYNGEFMG